MKYRTLNLLKEVVAPYNIRNVNFLESLIRFLADSTGNSGTFY